MTLAKRLVIASSDFANTSKSLSWSDVLAGNWGSEMKPTTIVFACINDNIHSKGLLRRIREPSITEAAVWPTIKDVLDSMGEIMDVIKDLGFQKITLKPLFVLFLGFPPSDGGHVKWSLTFLNEVHQ